MVRNSLLSLSLLACTFSANAQLSPDASPKAIAVDTAIFGKDPKAVAVQLPAGVDKWRFAHQNAAALGHVNIKALRESPLWAEMMKEAPGGMPVSLLDEIDEIWMSAPAVPQVKLVASAAPPKPPQPLMLMTGKFQNPEWKNIFKNQPGVAGASALLVGDLPVVALAKRRMLLPTAPATALRKRANELGAANDVFFIMNSGVMPQEAIGMAGMFGQVKGMELAFSLRQDFQSEIRLLAGKETIDSVMGMFEMMRGQMGQGPDAQKQLADMAKNIQVDRMAEGVSFKFKMSTAEIREAMAKQKDPRPSVKLDETTNIKISEPTVIPQPVKPGKIRIQGLEDGPKEIPYIKK